MTKYDRMVATNKATSTAKIAKAKAEISKMVSENIQVTVGELVKRTGLSRGFFYKNEEVSRALENARDLQDGKALTRPQKVILDKAMDGAETAAVSVLRILLPIKTGEKPDESI